MRVKIRSRLAQGKLARVLEPKHHGDPEDVGLVEEHLPRAGDQFISASMRAFSVDFVEWRFDIGEVHVFCTELADDQPRPLEVLRHSWIA